MARPWLWATHVWNMFDFGAAHRCEGGKQRTVDHIFCFQKTHLSDILTKSVSIVNILFL